MKKSLFFLTLTVTLAQAAQQAPQNALASTQDKHWSASLQRIATSASNKLPCTNKPDQATYEKLVRDTAQDIVKNNNLKPLEQVIKKGYHRPWTKEGMLIECLVHGCALVAASTGLISGYIFANFLRTTCKNSSELADFASIAIMSTVASRVYSSFLESALRKKLYSFVLQQKKTA